ncbi:MAG: BACON domain-containing protein [Alistipes sp.]|nr:BACON domain-containing protein [Alistipes sp.]
MSGNGDATVNLSVPTNDTGAVRSAVVKCIAMHPEYGKWDTKRVNISQSANEKPVGPSGDVLYSDNFDGQLAEAKYGTSGTSWPFVDQFPEFANPQGPAAANVTYTATNVSIRANSPSNGNYSLYKDSASGNNNVFFGGAGNMFVINGIALAADQSNLQLTFGRYRSLFGASDNTFVASEFHIWLSKNGTAWTEISYETPVDAASEYGTWNLATADFTLTEVPETLYIKFTSDLASSHRIDDVKLSTGNGGQSVTLPEGAVIVGGTIAAAIATADGSEAAVDEATVIGIYNKGFLMEDATGKLLVYTNETATVSVGDKVSGSGTIASYAGFKQFAAVKDASGEYGAAPTVTVIGSGSFTQPAPEVLDGAGMDAYLSAPAVKYIQYTGTLSISGNYYNVVVDGASKAKGSVAYPMADAIDPALNGQVVTIKGYAIGVTGTVYVNTMLVELEGQVSTEPSLSVSPESLSFAADGGVKEITATLKNSTDAITASSDNAQFSVAVAGNVITVTAAANETTENISGTITVNAGALSKTVAVSQAGKSSGNEKTLTFSFSDIVAANSDLPTNGYGSQTAANESTWISWTADNVLFKGSRICQANGDNAGYLQMQGNASDAAKQGFFGNADAVPGTIKKIVVKSFNTKYVPNFNLYLDNTAFPTVNGVNAEPNSDGGEASGKGKIYTTTFEIGGAYTYFALRNDTTGAFYFDSITIYYE